MIDLRSVSLVDASRFTPEMRKAVLDGIIGMVNNEKYQIWNHGEIICGPYGCRQLKNPSR